MRVGTKSLLFGVHQVILHPLFVLIAWWHLYGRPSWRELVCIVIHDWGYWGKPNMDGAAGEKHPVLGARLARRLFGVEYGNLTLLHSRHYARIVHEDPSRLCWADKLSHLYYPTWLYLFLARTRGEIREYRQMAQRYIPLEASDEEWFKWIQDRFYKLAMEQRGDAVPYHNRAREATR
jgi:hypothetical protein